MANFSRSVGLATALQAYASRSKTDRGDTDTLLQLNKLRAGSFDKIFPAMFSLHGLDIKEAINRAIKDGDVTSREAEIAIQAISLAMSNIANTYPVLTEAIFNSVNNEVTALINEFNVGGTDRLESDKFKRMEVHIQNIKKIFSTPYIVTYFEGSKERVPSLKIAHNSFANLRDIVNKRIKAAIGQLLKENKITRSKFYDDTYLTTKVINWGHTRTTTGIITGKLLAELLSARRAIGTISAEDSESVLRLISDDFIEQTGQEKTVIKVHHGDITKGDPNLLTLVIESGIFQTVIVQNRRENQEDLSQAERKWNLLDAVGRKNLLSALKMSSIQELARTLLKVKSSPSIIDNIGSLVGNTIAGIKTTSTSKTINLLNKSVPIKKKRKKIKVSNNTNKNKLRKDTASIIRTQTGQFYSLASLQKLLDSLLVLKVKENMGDGNRRDILNLRSGRFAESVKVERISQSREGMVTAFYSYMKNPYATFSEGGRQQYPRSRDPKLLISKSIREIAATKVANRMRAVAL